MMGSWLEFPSPQVPRRRLAWFGGSPGNPAAFFELDHVVLPDRAVVGQRHREHLTRAAHALPSGCFGQIVVAVPPGLLSRIRDQLEDSPRTGRDLAARTDYARLLLSSCHAPIQTAVYPRPAAIVDLLSDSDPDRTAVPTPSRCSRPPGRRVTLTKRDQPRNAKARASPPISVVSGWISINTSAVQMRPFCAPQTGSWSGPQDDPPTTASRPGRLDLGQGYLVDGEQQVASGCEFSR